MPTNGFHVEGKHYAIKIKTSTVIIYKISGIRISRNPEWLRPTTSIFLTRRSNAFRFYWLAALYRNRDLDRTSQGQWPYLHFDIYGFPPVNLY